MLTVFFVTDQSYPREMLQFLKKLGKQLEKFAEFIGFTEEEMKTLKSSAATMEKQIRKFSRVWRMPDLTFEKNDEVLEMTLRAAGIDTGVYSTHKIISVCNI